MVSEIGPSGSVVQPRRVAVILVYVPPSRFVIVTLPLEFAVSKIGVCATPSHSQFMV